VAILDHDDRLTPDSLSDPPGAPSGRSHVGLVYGDLQLMTPEGVVYGEQRFPELATERAFVQACLTRAIGPLKHGTVLLDRAVALAEGNYNPALTVEYDLDLILRVALAKGHRHLPVPVIQYRVHPGNFSRTLRYRLQQIHLPVEGHGSAHACGMAPPGRQGLDRRHQPGQGGRASADPSPALAWPPRIPHARRLT
jgi:hypothetical protein